MTEPKIEQFTVSTIEYHAALAREGRLTMENSRLTAELSRLTAQIQRAWAAADAGNTAVKEVARLKLRAEQAEKRAAEAVERYETAHKTVRHDVIADVKVALEMYADTGYFEPQDNDR